MIIDGRQMAREVLAHAKARAQMLPKQPRVVAIVCNETSATKSYLSIKSKRAIDAGCVLEICQLDSNNHTELLQAKIIEKVKEVSEYADAVIVQLPLPEGVDSKAVCDAIPVNKDADVLSSDSRDRFTDMVNPYLLPPVVSAVKKILESGNIELTNKKAVVIGDGWLVGNPCAKWLEQNGVNVEVVTSKTDDLSAALRAADIIVSGAGSSHIIKPEMLKEAKSAEGGSPDGSQREPFRGVVLIDAGTSESNGEVAGDADPACAEKCSIFTPVPGGVGPLAVACLFENAVTLTTPQGVALR